MNLRISRIDKGSTHRKSDAFLHGIALRVTEGDCGRLAHIVAQDIRWS